MPVVNGQMSEHKVRNGTKTNVLPGQDAKSTVWLCWLVNGSRRMAVGTGRFTVAPTSGDGALVGDDEQAASRAPKARTHGSAPILLGRFATALRQNFYRL